MKVFNALVVNDDVIEVSLLTSLELCLSNLRQAIPFVVGFFEGPGFALVFSCLQLKGISLLNLSGTIYE